jgi:hypothetical protein
LAPFQHLSFPADLVSGIASRILSADARRRGIDIHATLAGDGLWGPEARA